MPDDDRAGATWPAEVVAIIRRKPALRIRAGRAPHRFLGIWAVTVGDRVFVRSWNDSPAGWRRAWLSDPLGAMLVGDDELPALAKPVRDEALRDAVSAAYVAKYWRPASLPHARGLDTPARRETTLELCPVAVNAGHAADLDSGRAPR